MSVVYKSEGSGQLINVSESTLPQQNEDSQLDFDGRNILFNLKLTHATIQNLRKWVKFGLILFAVLLLVVFTGTLTGVLVKLDKLGMEKKTTCFGKELESVKLAMETQGHLIKQQGQTIQEQAQKLKEQEEKFHQLVTTYAMDIENVTKLSSLLKIATDLEKAVQSNTIELKELRDELNEVNTSVEETAKEIKNLTIKRTEIRKGPVFQLRETDVYSLTFEEGEKLCSDHGTSMASEGDVREAQRMGLDLCACGWVSNRKAIYPTQWARPNCGNMVGIPRCLWQGTWHVWCKTKIF